MFCNCVLKGALEYGKCNDEVIAGLGIGNGLKVSSSNNNYNNNNNNNTRRYLTLKT